jgi:hypothetical protein
MLRVGVVYSCLAALAFMSGCQLAQMQVSPALEKVPPLPVNRAFFRKPDDPLSFGSWQTLSIDVGWATLRSSQGSAGFDRRSIDLQSFKKPYRIELATGSGVILAECLTRAQRVTYRDWSLDSGALQGIPPLSCTYRGAGDGTLELFEIPKLTESLAGRIEFDANNWSVEAVDRIAGARMPDAIVGYEIRRGAEVIAAVETINKGRVWMSPALEPLDRDRVAAVATTLLLYESPQAELERDFEHDVDRDRDDE